jgi:glycosyltransferase involved in cell wall biosynthesis
VLATESVDLIHMHCLDFHHYLPSGTVPIIATLHLPPEWYPVEIFRSSRENLYLNCVSYSQQKTCPKSSLLLPPIPNGVDISKLDGPELNRRHVLALGRICPEKGFHYALDAAKKAGADLVLAGELIPYQIHQDYFQEQIAPRLDERRRFIGPVGFERKKRLLRESTCLVIPSTVQETSSLVAMEALATGTPVIAFRSGALPEIIEHGRTGYLVSDVREMARAIKSVDKLDRNACRRVARQFYSADRMAERYLQLYRKLITKHPVEQHSERSARAASSWLVNW